MQTPQKIAIITLAAIKAKADHAALLERYCSLGARAPRKTGVRIAIDLHIVAAFDATILRCGLRFEHEQLLLVETLRFLPAALAAVYPVSPKSPDTSSGEGRSLESAISFLQNLLAPFSQGQPEIQSRDNVENWGSHPVAPHPEIATHSETPLPDTHPAIPTAPSHTELLLHFLRHTPSRSQNIAPLVPPPDAVAPTPEAHPAQCCGKSQPRHHSFSQEESA